jgi:hypothetical protein
VRDQFSERANTEPEIVAHHFTQAGLPSPAVEWWSKAADLATRRPAYPEAIAHLEMALQMAERLGDTPDQRRMRLRLQITKGNTLRMARGFGVAETQAAYAVTRDLVATVEDVSERFPAYFGLFIGSYCRVDLPSMRDVSEAFLRDVESRPTSPEAVMAPDLRHNTLV